MNASIALFVAIGYAAFGMRLLQTVQADAAVHRLLTLCRRDIRRAAQGRLAQNAHRWIQSYDRPDRFTAAAATAERACRRSATGQMLRDIRTGLAVIHLRRSYPAGGSSGYRCASAA